MRGKKTKKEAKPAGGASLAPAKVVVILFNLGAPCCPASTRPFLNNLFGDKAIINLPNPFRWLLAKVISFRRAPKVNEEVYSNLGGRSPLLEETYDQANALENLLEEKAKQGEPALKNLQVKTVVAMRCSQPTIEQVVELLKAHQPDKIVLLPLYPQFSTTTTGSAFLECQEQIKKQNLKSQVLAVRSYQGQEKFVDAWAHKIMEKVNKLSKDKRDKLRVLFSAHGLPEKIVKAGDPYPEQIKESVVSIVESLEDKKCALQDWSICYQSKVGPLKWIEPSLDQEIERAGKDGKGVIVVPIAFVSEHSETLVELDMEYKHMADENKIPFYVRVDTVRVEPLFIESLGESVISALHKGEAMPSL